MEFIDSGFANCWHYQPQNITTKKANSIMNKWIRKRKNALNADLPLIGNYQFEDQRQFKMIRGNKNEK